MFQDGRSRRVVFLAHCLLNQNAISDGTAAAPAALREVVDTFLDAGVGIVQMPCPEFSCLGLDRGDIHGAERPVVEENTRIRAALSQTGPDRMLTALAEQVVTQILDYHRHGFEIVGIVGANRSPSCGVDTTSQNNQEVPGQGVFLTKLARRLEEEGLTVPMAGVKASDSSIQKLQELL